MSHDRQGASAPNFTPGPWQATQDRHLGLFVCSKHNHDNQICEISTHNGADARLISACPDLYEALEDALEKMWSFGFREDELQPIRSALAKARGEA
jgi:hypothetical protein